jgi:hypothetical protein
VKGRIRGRAERGGRETRENQEGPQTLYFLIILMLVFNNNNDLFFNNNNLYFSNNDNFSYTTSCIITKRLIIVT